MAPDTLTPLIQSLQPTWQIFSAFATIAICLGLVLVPLLLVSHENWKRRV